MTIDDDDLLAGYDFMTKLILPADHTGRSLTGALCMDIFRPLHVTYG